MINHIQIKNFKSIKDLYLDLRRVNILIGSNGAGKSNFINFFSFVNTVYEGKLSAYALEKGGASRVIHLGMDIGKEIYGLIEYSTKDRYIFKIASNERDSFYVKNEKYEEYNAATDTRDSFFEGTDMWESALSDNLVIGSILNNLNFGQFRVYHFHDTSKNAPLKQTARTDDTRFLRIDGSNLAAVIYNLQQNHIRSFNQIEATVRIIAPYFDKFDLQPNGEYIRLNWRQKGTDMYLDASDLSDGTIRFIALVTLLLQPNLPPTILIDEPELGLHPSAITILAGLVQSVSRKSQIILSTQSVNLVNQFDPEDIIVVENRNNESIFHRLEEAELSDWLKEYTLGEIWNKNLIGGNP